MIKKIWFIIITTFFLWLCGCSNLDNEFFEAGDDESAASLGFTENEINQVTEVKEDEKIIFVYVCGAVMHPGVYELHAGDRVCSAIEAAGGMAADAVPDYLNQAKILKDADQIRIPSVNDELRDYSIQDEDDGRVNINLASKEELLKISGIGESRAEAIILYREENGRFNEIEDIMNVAGIKDGLFSKIKDKIKVF